MEELSHVSKARAILVAVNAAVDSNFTVLHQLISVVPKTLSLELFLRILVTFLPETVAPPRYIPLLLELAPEYAGERKQGHVDISVVKGLTEDEARDRVRRLRLLRWQDVEPTPPESIDPLAAFLILRARRIDAQTGLLELGPQLLIPFLKRSEHVRAWYIGRLLPLLRFDHYHPQAIIDIYLPSSQVLEQLPLEQVEQIVLEAVTSAYDNASNGERTRGEMKRAYDMWVSEALADELDLTLFSPTVVQRSCRLSSVLPSIRRSRSRGEADRRYSRTLCVFPNTSAWGALPTCQHPRPSRPDFPLRKGSGTESSELYETR